MFYTVISTKTKRNKKMSNPFELIETNQEKTVIKVISMSESGDDAVRHIAKQIDGMDFIYFDAIENTTNLHDVLNGADMVFLIGATTNDSKLNEISEIALELKILTIVVVTKPIDVSKNITQLLCHVDESKTLNDVLLESVQGITDCVFCPGMINVDFSDIQRVLSGKSRAIISVNSEFGENRAFKATKQAMSSPLFHDIDLKTVCGILVNISASDMGIMEFSEIGDIVTENLSEDCTVKIGMSIKPDLDDTINVAIVMAV
jgi:cell division protein FtsZ